MKKIGIITIHKIENYGSVLQAYALQRQCEMLGYDVEIIDYNYPNSFHRRTAADKEPDSIMTFGQKVLKFCYAIPILRRNKLIRQFPHKYLHLSDCQYKSPEEIKNNPPLYDIYLTGSDQVWNSHFCKGDPVFLLHFAPDSKTKIAYAASFGSSVFNDNYKDLYVSLLSRYKAISVRESSGISIVSSLIDKTPKLVLDPTLLLGADEWNRIATPKRIIKQPYILCYYLNYSFDSYPYVDNLAEHFQKLTGFKIVRIGKPPKRVYGRGTKFIVDASPEDFLALIRDSEMVLTTSFHGTAFSINYGKPFISVVGSEKTTDSRVVNFLRLMNLESQKLVINCRLPSLNSIYYDIMSAQSTLVNLRNDSITFLQDSVSDGDDNTL